MANVIVDLQSLRIDVDEAVVNAYYKGNSEATAQIHSLIDEALRSRKMYELIENIEVDEYEELEDNSHD